jgi:dihydrofolate synthase/folylpolyglutamate synthase
MNISSCRGQPVDYQGALDYIYSFANFETRPVGQQMRENYTLDRIRGLLSHLGEPQHCYPTVHITGTKGKGSTAAILASILEMAGYRTGLFTSPHLHTYRERIQVNRQLISEPEVVEWIDDHRQLLDGWPGLTTFEVTTAMAFDVFAQRGVDVAVIEVGLGGRVDTTNVITPKLSIITSISLDHTSILGSTLRDIAADKSGIIKPGVPVVTAPQEPEALAEIQSAARKVGAPVTQVGADWSYQLIAASPAGQTIEMVTPEGRRLQLWMPLIGAHEALNAAVGIVSAFQLRDAGWRLDVADITAGVRTVSWPGRTEVLHARPWVMVDGAHNLASAQCLVETIELVFGHPPVELIFGASVDKQIGGMLEVLLPVVDRVVVTRADHPRAAAPAALRAAVERYGRPAAAVPTVARALEVAMARAAEDDLILATGSLFVAGDARMAWFKRAGQPLPPRDLPRSP